MLFFSIMLIAINARPLSSEVCIEIKHTSLTCAWEQLSKLFNHQ
jgi:hypothetical protein